MSLRPARRCLPYPDQSLLTSPLVRPYRRSLVRHLGIRLFTCCLLLVHTCSQAELTGRHMRAQVRTWESCQTGVPSSTIFELPQGGCQTIPPCLCTALSLQHMHGIQPASSLICSLQGTCWRRRPRARLRGSAFHKLNRSWAYRGCGLGEASNPGPNGGGPVRSVTIHRVPMGEEPARPCTIRMATQGGVWIWIVHSHPPLRVAGRKAPAKALQKWLHKFQDQILPASQAALRDLLEQWRSHPIPPPIPRPNYRVPCPIQTHPELIPVQMRDRPKLTWETARLLLPLSSVRTQALLVGFARRVHLQPLRMTRCPPQRPLPGRTRPLLLTHPWRVQDSLGIRSLS